MKRRKMVDGFTDLPHTLDLLVIVKNSSPHRQSADCWLSVGRLLVICRPTVGRLLAVSWPTVDQYLTDS